MGEKPKAEDPHFERWLNPKTWTTGWQPFMGTNQFALDDWMKSSVALLNGVLAISREMVDFTQARLREDVEVLGKFARCRGPQETAECQSEFIHTATSQYLDHASKLTGLMATLTSESFNPARHAVAQSSEVPVRKSR